MSMQDDASSPPEPGVIEMEVPPPAWPKVVGIISIVWGSLGLTCAGCGLAYFAGMPYLFKMAEQQQGPAPAVMYPPGAMYVITAIGLLWAALLLTAGIMTVKRNPGGRAMHLVYGVGAILMTAASTYINMQWQAQIAEAAKQDPGNLWLKQAAMGGNWKWVGTAFGLLLGLSWPVFCLVWFGVAKRTPESMTGGAQPASAPGAM